MSYDSFGLRPGQNPFFVMAGLYLAIGLVALAGVLSVEAGLVSSLPRPRWLTVHLVTIGGLTQALFGALPALAARRHRGSGRSGPARPTGSTGTTRTPGALASPGADRSTPRSGDRWLQWLLLNAGYPLVLVGMASGSVVTAVAGATVVLAAVALLAATVVRVSDAGDKLSRYYLVAPAFLGVGILAAFGMLLGYHGPGGYFGSLEAHVHANVWGFLALVAAATLLAVVPHLSGTDLRYPRLVPVTFWGLALGAGGLVAGPWLARHELTFLGLAVYVVGTVALLANVVGTHRSAGCVRDSRVAHVLGAYLWLVFPVPWAPFVLLAPDLVPGAAIERAAINGLVFGWMLQLAMAFLPEIVAAADRSAAGTLDLAGLGDSVVRRPSWLCVASVNLGLLALWAAAFPVFGPVADALTLGGFALVALAWTDLVVALWSVLAGRNGPGSGEPKAHRAETSTD